MGLNVHDIKFLLWAKKKGVDFTKVVTIGRQKLYLDVNAMQSVLSTFGMNESKNKLEAILSDQKGFAEPFFKLLGTTEADSIDASSYEGASHVLDMNQPIKENLKGKFSVVIDGGSLEHVFNFPVAIRNCMEMIQPSGHFIGIVPCNNFMGHGFYQFSPELFFRIFTEQNGFQMEKMVLYETSPMARWYEVSDPQKIGKRAEVRTRRNTLLIILARKVAVKPLFETVPQQSDYSAIWQKREANKQNGTVEPSPSAVSQIPIPFFLKKIYWNLKEAAQPRIHLEAFKEIQKTGLK
ncbi:MAG TPA: hypothetical protein VIK59_11125 [Verrucomicrobiae bacterium]